MKFDVEGTGAVNDLDNWDDLALAQISAKYPTHDLDTLKGVAIKGGQQEIWYDFDNDPSDVDTAPVPPFVVEDSELDAAGDAAGKVTFTGSSYDFILF